MKRSATASLDWTKAPVLNELQKSCFDAEVSLSAVWVDGS